MKTAIILGPDGQLGSDVCAALKNKNIKIIPLDQAQLDLEKDDIQSTLSKHANVDYLINGTSYHNVDECEDNREKTCKMNAEVVKTLAKHCADRDIILFHISTDYVFDGQKNTPYTEEDPPHALNVYGDSKIQGENHIREICEKAFVFRVSSLFGIKGPFGKKGNFVDTMITLASSGKPLKVVNDQIMSPTHTLDVARVITHFIDHNITDYGLYHVTGEGQCSWHDFAATIFKKTGIAADLSPTTSNEYKTKAKRPAYSVLSNDKINKICPMKPWEEMLDEYLKLKTIV